MLFCEHCGSPLPENAAFCTECGARVTPAAPRPEPVEAEPTAPPQQTYEPEQPAYAPPQQAYAPEQPVYAPLQQTYEPEQPAYAPPQQTYTRFSEPAGGYTPPGGGYAPPAAPPAKKNKKTLLIVLIVVGVLVLAAVALVVIGLLAGRAGGAASHGKDEYVGAWEAQSYKMVGQQVDAEDVGVSTMLLNADGSMSLTLMGEVIDGMEWEVTQDGIRVSAGALEYEAEYDDGALVMDVTVFKVFFERADSSGSLGGKTEPADESEKDGVLGGLSGSIGGGTEPADESEKDGVLGGLSGSIGGKTEPADTAGGHTAGGAATAAEQWDGYWYGSFWVEDTFGDVWADTEDNFIDFYGYISVDEDGFGWLDANDIDLDEVGDEGVVMSMYIQADAEHFEQTGADAWFSDMEIVEGENGLDYTVYPVDGNPDMFLIEATYTDPDYPDGSEGFDFVITFLRWGCQWDYSVDSVDPPGYEGYLESLN